MAELRSAKSLVNPAMAWVAVAFALFRIAERCNPMKKELTARARASRTEVSWLYAASVSAWLPER